MATTKNSYDVVVTSHGLASLFSSIACSNKNKSVLLLNSLPVYEAVEKDFRLYPYELPIFGFADSEYSDELARFLGSKEYRNLFLAVKAPVGVIFGNNRFDYFLPIIEEEIKREFPDCEKDFNHFIDEILFLEDKIAFLRNYDLKDKVKFIAKNPLLYWQLFNSDINFLYDKHNLPLKIRSLLNSIIFVFSGSVSNRFSAVCSVLVMAGVLKGVTVPSDDVYSLRNTLLGFLSKNVDVEVNMVSNKAAVGSSFLISDYDHMKDVFISNFDNFKNEYSETIRYPYSLYVKVSKEMIPESMSRWLVFVDVDKSSLLNYEDIYVVRCIMEGETAVIRVTSFVPYGYFELNNEIHKNKVLRMMEVLERIIPGLKESRLDVYPNPNSEDFEFELNKIFNNLIQGDVVYEVTDEKFKVKERGGKTMNCGRETIPSLGFEGLMNRSIWVSAKVINKRS